MLERINLSKTTPDLYGVVRHLDKLVSESAASAGIADGFAHLLRLRASHINQCAFCMRMHARDAVKSGETADRLSVLSAWREASAYFTDKERAALELLEAITLWRKGRCRMRSTPALQRRCLKRRSSRWSGWPWS